MAGKATPAADQNKQLEEALDERASSSGKVAHKAELQPEFMVSTGSTLLDLSISGKRIRGGGIPAGLICEFFGPSQSGKTALLVEIGASAMMRGGEVDYLDPEARFDLEYARLFGMELDKRNYHRPDTVTDMFDIIRRKKVDPNRVNVTIGDSLAALSTKLEMDNDEGDKMGMRRAKEFSEGLRKHARLLAANNRILACSNQVRQGDSGEVTPGGKGIPFYASVRCRIAQDAKVELTKTLTSGKEVSKVIGIRSRCKVIKTIDDPFRECDVYIIFGHGIDDIRGNLQYIKDMTKATKYWAVDKEYVAMNHAIKHVEDNELEGQLRDATIDLWLEIEETLTIPRKSKKRI